ncbi:LysM repeat-containing protein [Desemzia incerta]|uniref:LysM repeat-containing protein n=1 Tax=Desemzia incerta TaxID=82801 RepID=A0A1I5WS31_9LACT|nr:LysM domain-containing protein [Desemzia incerta]SFQ22549.1 LysM repeat-containing protein [Desemzia incerta]
MARKKKGHSNDADELWSRKFDEDEGYTNGNYSRTERKKADKAISPVLKSLWIFLALFIILPTGVYLWYTYNDQDTTAAESESETLIVKENEADNSEEKQPEKESSESKSESKETEAAEEKSESSQAASSESSKEIESSQAVESESKPVEESEATESSQAAESKPADASKTYTVKPGDNLYRIALNHGMSTDQLKTLNGLTTDEVAVGTVLMVK